MSGAGFISNMIQSSKSNLSLKKNIRKKYGRDLRKTFHTDKYYKSKETELSKHSAVELASIKSEMIKYKKNQKQKELILLIVFVLILAIFIVTLSINLNK